MPPKPSISRDMIVDAAFEQVRQRGLGALSARSIAMRLGCSTQPVYSCFSSMKALETAVIARAASFVETRYLARDRDPGNHFMAIGLGYVEMARRDAHLFDLLYLSGRIELDFENARFPVDPRRLIDAMRKDPWLAPFSDAEMLRMLNHMWIYTHGLTALARANPALSENFITRSLSEMGATVVAEARRQKGIDPHETACPERQP